MKISHWHRNHWFSVMVRNNEAFNIIQLHAMWVCLKGGPQIGLVSYLYYNGPFDGVEGHPIVRQTCVKQYPSFYHHFIRSIMSLTFEDR